jgi:hypothetical protein
MSPCLVLNYKSIRQKNEGKIGRIFKPLETSRVLIPEDKRKEKIKELLKF